MRLVVQRVLKAQLSVADKLISSIDKGYFVLVGIGNNDTQKDGDLLAEKLWKLRVMGDQNGKMNLSVGDINGEMLVVSQFTLMADTKGGNRPSFVTAARPDVAKPLYDYFIERLQALGCSVQTGVFGADMKIDATLDGPVTILLES